MGRVSAISSAPPGASDPEFLATGITYQAFGPVKAIAYANGIAESRHFDADYRNTQLSARGNMPVESLSYGYDAADNVLSVADGVVQGNSQTLGYDALNRLTSAQGPYGTLAYTYDENGNRLTESSSATTDGLGASASFSYNQAGQLSAVSNGSGQSLTQYTYDGFGHRTVKIGSVTGTTIYQYDAQDRLLEESDGQGNGLVDYVYLDGLPIAIFQPTDGKIFFLHTDRLGTPQMATDFSQNVVWSTTYQPFGLMSSTPAIIDQNLRLPGQEADLETGLNHNGFRDYLPAFGRYIERDPIGLAGGLNAYVYAKNSPLSNIDLLGLCAISQVADAAYAAGLNGAGGAGIEPTEPLDDGLTITHDGIFYFLHQVFRFVQTETGTAPEDSPPQTPFGSIGIRG